jgi:hypothetical protein
MNVLILLPMKPNLHQVLKDTARALLKRLPQANPTLTLEMVIDERGVGDAKIRTLEERVAHTSVIRQGMIDDYLKPETDFVLWIDADIINYPADLPTKLITRGKGNVAAPFVLFDSHGRRFYDIAGFIEKGKWFNLYPPYCQQAPVDHCYELDSVGCVVLFPASIYRAGATHKVCKGYTDWFGVCQRAKELGFKVYAFDDLLAWHADLNKFGEAYH